ncbi:ESAT-6 protein secretion system EspG family protein [Herbihabitans rhizosphaerae]|uniref:ESAT-6 protein secretion system EspG family protein n=1 Tax=Herbihabitans rhizosphaerae TaxID=1872711 RepID=A0A4Q7KBP2_9PSEU|nr:ESX secretion-associated protein EspG [Herbihabitans rhizosphaerae]RZS30377.1 ESAT-6 protein secretion system EspG family protein [Herbihabitans rhizosphaerae]
MTSATVHTWTLGRAAMTALLAEFELGDMPQPFEADYPYTTTAERESFHAKARSELESAGVLRAGGLVPDAERAFSAITSGPVGIIAMGTFPGEHLLARGAWYRRDAVLAQQHGDTVYVADLGTSSLVNAVVALIPDAEPATGTSVTVPSGQQVPQTREDEEFALFDDIDAPSAHRAGTPGAPASVAKIFSNPVVRCGAFVPFSERELLQPLTWFDTSGPRGITRHFAMTTADGNGALWTTYVPGDNARIEQSLRGIVDSQLR